MTLVVPLIGSSMDALIDSLSESVFDSLIDSSFDVVINSLIGSLIDSLNDSWIGDSVNVGAATGSAQVRSWAGDDVENPTAKVA